MKYCLINNLYPPYARGGSEKIVSLVANGLKNSGRVMLITTQPDDQYPDQTENSIEVFRLRPRNLYYLLDDYKKNRLQKFFWHFFDLFCRKTCAELERILKEAKPDLVMTHNLKGLGFAGFSVIRKLGLPHIHTLHDYQLLDPHGSMHRQGQNLPLNGPFYRLYRYFTKQAVKSPDLVISPSKYVLSKHLEYGFFEDSKTEVIPNPSAVMPSEAKVPSNKLRLVYLGQIEKHKGIEFLVRSFLDFSKKDCELLIAGIGSQLNLIRELAKADERIKVLGKVEHSHLSDLFARADLLVVPSIWWENSPTVIYEAYAAKLPVLVTDSGGAKELVVEGETGWIFQSGNKKSLLVKLNLAFNFKTKLPSMGEKGFRLAWELSLEKYLEKLLGLCQNLRK